MTTDNTEPVNDVGTPQVEAEAEQPLADTSRQFSQAEVNQIMTKTRREVRGQFSDYDTLKERAAKADELEAAQLSEAEKLTQRVAEAERVATQANAQISEARISGEVKVKAVQLGIVDPDAAFLLMDRSGIEYDAEKGVTGVDESLTQLLEDKPYLKGSAVRSPNINPEGGTPAPVTRLTEEQREAARLMGMTEEDYSKGL